MNTNDHQIIDEYIAWVDLRYNEGTMITPPLRYETFTMWLEYNHKERINDAERLHSLLCESTEIVH